MSEHDTDPAFPRHNELQQDEIHRKGLLDKTLKSFPKNGIDIRHTVESICQSTVKATLPADNFWGKEYIEEKLIESNCNYTDATARDAVAKKFEELKIPPEMCTRVLADGRISKLEAVQLMAQIGITFQSRFNDEPTREMLRYAEHFAKKYHIEDSETIIGLAYFEKFGQEASAKVREIIDAPSRKMAMSGDATELPEQRLASKAEPVALLLKI